MNPLLNMQSIHKLKGAYLGVRDHQFLKFLDVIKSKLIFDTRLVVKNSVVWIGYYLLFIFKTKIIFHFSYVISWFYNEIDNYMGQGEKLTK